ncbi:MAG: hypothetical protein JXM69_03410 [Anaerolineae bacterium]|nr:hypothetical protein [Anaerolineae bacterium]
MKNEKTIVIDINLTRGLVGLLALALLLAAFGGYLAWGQGEVAASGMQAPLASSAGMRGYYLTQDKYNGANADGTDGNGAGVCASGYHFASLWEIMEPSNLKYDTALGEMNADSGQGPPNSDSDMGWVRTGYDNSISDTAGLGNCAAWTSPSSGDRGTWASLPINWTSGQDIHVWWVGPTPCNTSLRVWCVED